MNAEQLRKKILEKTKKQVREKLSGKETHITKAMNALEDLELMFNMLFEDVREWYSLHFPELFSVVKDPDKCLLLISELGQRENFKKNEIEKLYSNPEAVALLEEKAKNSIGGKASKENIAQISSVAKKALELRKQKDELASHIEREMLEQTPNLAKVAGPMLGAKLLCHAKSLKKLAFVPSSTIQLMGAEKALFKHLRKGTKPPKHGIIFQHPLMRRVRKENRGKMARALANKISIAAKEDYFGKNDISQELIKELEEKAKMLT
ncbi:MAG: NOP58 family protein [Candidatus Diapherotrites archaeon]|nr:NOP58 family protein [Candidatus Diapherotrites archaeon]